VSQSVSDHNRRSLLWEQWAFLTAPPLLVGALYYGQAQQWFSLAERDFKFALTGCLLIPVGVLIKAGASEFDSKARQFAEGCAIAGVLSMFAKNWERVPYELLFCVFFAVAYIAVCYHYFLIVTGKLEPKAFRFANPPEILTANRRKPKKSPRRKAKARAKTAAR
jgi:hypothetical protein